MEQMEDAKVEQPNMKLGTKERGWRDMQPGQTEDCPPIAGNRTLAALVLAAVARVEDDEMRPPGNATNGPVAPAFQPRMMLAMLTYCYAVGVYGSEEAEAMMFSDGNFRALCGMEYPDWKRLKRFRRDNHPVLLRTLEETFRGLWRLNGGARGAMNGNGNGRRPECSNGLPDTAREDSFANEARACIERAMFIDQMAVE